MLTDCLSWRVENLYPWSQKSLEGDEAHCSGAWSGSLPPGTNLFIWLVTLWEEYSGCSSVNQRTSHQSPRLATFSVTGKERLSHLRIPRVMIGGDSHLSTPLGADGCSATRSWFQMWAAGVSLPCGPTSPVTAVNFLISLRGSAVSTRTVITMGPSRCIWEGESVTGASQLLESAQTSEAEKGWAATSPGPRMSLRMNPGSGRLGVPP